MNKTNNMSQVQHKRVI